MSKEKVGVLITARLKSRRLPKKVILEIAGKPLISHMLDRMRLAKCIDEIVVCTSTNAQDDPLGKIARDEGVLCYRGSPDDVLLRLYNAALEYNINFIVNVTADCPLLDPMFIDDTVRAYRESGADVIRIKNLNLIGQRPIGVKFSALKKVCEIKDETETECWLDYFVKPGIFRIHNLAVDERFVVPTLKTSIDYPEDYEFIKYLFNELHAKDRVFLLPDIISLVKQKPGLMLINSHCIKLGVKNSSRTAAPAKLKEQALSENRNDYK